MKITLVIFKVSLDSRKELLRKNKSKTNKTPKNHTEVKTVTYV